MHVWTTWHCMVETSSIIIQPPLPAPHLYIEPPFYSSDWSKSDSTQTCSRADSSRTLGLSYNWGIIIRFITWMLLDAAWISGKIIMAAALSRSAPCTVTLVKKKKLLECNRLSTQQVKNHLFDDDITRALKFLSSSPKTNPIRSYTYSL